MSDEVELLRRIATLEQRMGQIYDQVFCTYVPLTTALSEAGGALAGAALNVGTYTVGPVGGGATYSFNYPTTAKAVSVRLAATWAAAADASRAYCMSIGGGVPERSPFTKAYVANFQSDGSGTVNLDGNATFNIVVVNANTTALFLYILGYFL